MARILIVDDDAQIRDLLYEFLISRGHKVTSIGSGIEALGQIYSNSFEIVLLDIHLPQINGLSLLDIIRKRRPQTMVLLISGQATLDSAIEALKKGAFDYIKKPIILEELQKTIDRALEESVLMKSRGYIYKDSRRDDKSLIKNGIGYAVVDSIIAGLAFFLGFIIQAYIFNRIQIPLFIGSIELYQMSLGFAFCYSFIFVFRRGHRVDLFNSSSEMASHLFWNLSFSYILYLSVLFLIKDISFTAFKFAIGTGFMTGLIGLFSDRILLMPLVLSNLNRDGQKEIIVVNNEKSKMSTMRARRKLTLKMPKSNIETVRQSIDMPSPKTRILIKSQDIDRLSSKDNVEELHIPSAAFSPDQLMEVMDRFHNRKLKIVVYDDSADIPGQIDSASNLK